MFLLHPVPVTRHTRPKRITEPIRTNQQAGGRESATPIRCSSQEEEGGAGEEDVEFLLVEWRTEGERVEGGARREGKEELHSKRGFSKNGLPDALLLGGDCTKHRSYTSQTGFQLYTYARRLTAPTPSYTTRSLSHNARCLGHVGVASIEGKICAVITHLPSRYFLLISLLLHPLRAFFRDDNQPGKSLACTAISQKKALPSSLIPLRVSFTSRLSSFAIKPSSFHVLLSNHPPTPPPYSACPPTPHKPHFSHLPVHFRINSQRGT